ncbi:hypothetical protein [Lachnoanaerobaculum umeaense]|uniref:Uncharacterized protein n=1 Tax=Lachnoanaerobaculum umeaense TaxID=617123 RepID=A0A385PX81_9FIRM|nr:hypothetical protein [Lachnoanaerobaculum umeaense]AYA98758.1 hypothetical protein D4A81_01730 [Lachnoanaerobaculum umeaense]PZX00005.1 hypothetical protein C7439_101101 [Lachnoanaerobaculum umeaense]
MEILDQLGDTAKNIGAAAGDLIKQVVDKTGDALEISKVNSKISAEKVEIEKEKKKISDALFDKFAKGEEVPEEVKEFCENIKAHFSNIDNFNEEIEKIKEAAEKRAEEIKAAAEQRAKEAKEAAEKRAEEAKAAAEKKAEEAKEKLEDTVDEIKDTLEEKAEDTKDKLEEVKDDIK